jgi:hypothetical protein
MCQITNKVHGYIFRWLCHGEQAGKLRDQQKIRQAGRSLDIQARAARMMNALNSASGWDSGSMAHDLPCDVVAPQFLGFTHFGTAVLQARIQKAGSSAMKARASLRSNTAPKDPAGP